MNLKYLLFLFHILRFVRKIHIFYSFWFKLGSKEGFIIFFKKVVIFHIKKKTDDIFFSFGIEKAYFDKKKRISRKLDVRVRKSCVSSKFEVGTLEILYRIRRTYYKQLKKLKNNNPERGGRSPRCHLLRHPKSAVVKRYGKNGFGRAGIPKPGAVGWVVAAAAAERRGLRSRFYKGGDEIGNYLADSRVRWRRRRLWPVRRLYLVCTRDCCRLHRRRLRRRRQRRMLREAVVVVEAALGHRRRRCNSSPASR